MLAIEFEGAEGNILRGDIAGHDHEEGNDIVLFLHGGGQTRHAWKGTAQEFAASGRTAITLDARGHGESDHVPSGRYRFDHFAEDVNAVLEQITARYGRPIVVGASMGGLSSMLAHKMRVETGRSAGFDALVLVDIVPDMAASGIDRILSFMSDGLEAGFASVEDAAETVAAYLPNRSAKGSVRGLAKNLRQREDGRFVWHWDPNFVRGPNAIITGENNTAEAFNRAADTLDMPVLLIRGGRSDLVTPEAAQAFLNRVKQARFVDVSDAGHMVAGDRNDVFGEAVREFLDAL
ncbi:alpha/beta fold hydrolase [Ahrensia sp. R2A130]|uniref:alpha/beta fold hydrolase n=1 Tax=Ahrensia sp. R2A130 TaxID=744979 RepID=UPI0001E0F82D|nr:alpha/beta hydrolase [Ahrensia sp. R2A130]EFL90469.1 alpha/beta hydrolase fold protein [Ahrensia sp. R2A130]